jgi:hypothetical protein
VRCATNWKCGFGFGVLLFGGRGVIGGEDLG